MVRFNYRSTAGKEGKKWRQEPSNLVRWDREDKSGAQIHEYGALLSTGWGCFQMEVRFQQYFALIERALFGLVTWELWKVDQFIHLRGVGSTVYR